ncbi:MAG: hypothetical protein K1X81_09915 [Bacteroidia bacterium]|nr:hypothetical protein [Bacteroidia bacterium]
MRTQHKHISDLHTEHIDWLKQLQFYKDDLSVLQKHLEEAAAKNSSYETRAHVERFQNQFIRQNEVIDELRHEIKQHENELERTIKANPVATEHKLVIDHVSNRQNFHRFVELYDSMREDFTRFLSRVL